MGGLYSMVDKNVKEMNHIEGKTAQKNVKPSYFQFDSSKAMQKEYRTQKKYKTRLFPLLASSLYALSLAFGSIVWFYILAIILIHFRIK